MIRPENIDSGSPGLAEPACRSARPTFMRQWTLALLAVILVSGCAASRADGSSDTPPQSPTPSASPSSSEEPVQMPTVTVARSGGIAGVSDTYVVAPDGTLTVESRHAGSTGGKRLLPEELAELRRLVTGPALRAEAAADNIPPRCADGFVYSVTAGDVSARGMDCGDLATQAPTLARIVELVQTAAERP